MKNLFLTAILLMSFGTSANAMNADEMTDVIKCSPIQARPDMGMQLIVSTGGFAGITQVVVERLYLGHISSDTYIVRAAPRRLGRIGEPEVYKGANINLAINFTTRLPNGGSYGVLQITENDQTSVEELSCESLSPQINYPF